MCETFFNSRRLVNWALAQRTAAYRADETKLNWIALSREFTQLRAAPDTAWLGDMPRAPFEQVLRDQEHAFVALFAQRAQYPRFRRRGVPHGIRFTLDQRRRQVARGDDTSRWAHVNLPGLGTLKLRRSEELAGRLRSVTLRCEAGAWHASITADRVQVPWPTPRPASCAARSATPRRKSPWGIRPGGPDARSAWSIAGSRAARRVPHALR